MVKIYPELFELAKKKGAVHVGQIKTHQNDIGSFVARTKGGFKYAQSVSDVIKGLYLTRYVGLVYTDFNLEGRDKIVINNVNGGN